MINLLSKTKKIIKITRFDDYESAQEYANNKVNAEIEKVYFGGNISKESSYAYAVKINGKFV